MKRTAKYAAHFKEGYPSGQRGQTVNLLAYAFVGSNPTPSTSEGCGGVPLASTECGCSSMVERQPSKLITWVRFPSPAPNGCGPRSSVGRARPYQGRALPTRSEEHTSKLQS